MTDNLTRALPDGIRIDGDWVRDADGNRNSISYWGSVDAALRALQSLTDCTDCSECSKCSKCTDCSECTDCSYCSKCSWCTECSECSECTDCSYCSKCSWCTECSECSGCSGCSECSECSKCSWCTECSKCSKCSWCTECSECSYCSSTAPVSPPIPRISNIDAAVYAAASQPGALNMSKWHCGTAHCRAGHVVNLAGEAGAALEAYHNTALAAMLIYRESGSPINPARFYDDDEDALEDMRRRAEATDTDQH